MTTDREKLVEDVARAIADHFGDPKASEATKAQAAILFEPVALAVIRAQERTHALVPVEASEGEIAKAAQEYMDATKAMYAIKPIPKDQFTMKIPSDEQVRQMKAEAALVAALAYHRKTDGEDE